MRRAAYLLKYAIKKIRQGHNRDPKGYERDGAMDYPEFAESGILDAARALGIELGADRPGKLDVSPES
jgi:hypothetical protein